MLHVQVQKEQLVEAQHINKSLSSLGDVVSALVEASWRERVVMVITVARVGKLWCWVVLVKEVVEVDQITGPSLTLTYPNIT